MGPLVPGRLRALAVPFLLLLVGPAAAHAADRDPPAFRLGDAAEPIAYDVRLAIDPRAPRFSGEIRIRLRFARATPVLWLDGTGLDVDRAEVVQGGRHVSVQVIRAGEDFIGLESQGEPYAAGEATATLVYRGTLDALDSRGIFRQQEGGDWYAISQFETDSARRAFPCFDEPRWKTPWQLTIDAPVSDVVVSNTPEETATTLDTPAGWRRHVFAATRPLPSYLVALAVGPFDVRDGGRAGKAATPLRFVVPRGRAADVRVARESTPALVEFLEDYFGSPFPFRKLDTVTIPATVGFGAMENAGMITYDEDLVLARPYEETNDFRRRYASVAAHEIAHQWVGDLVTLAWWDDAWLNEAFATWMGHKALVASHPEWDRGWARGSRRRLALFADRLASARAVRNPVLAKTDIWGAFDPITYEKGAEVLSMFEAWLGPERFRAGVRDYLARHAGGNATSRDFFESLGRASGRPKEALDAFTAFIEQPGAPQLDVRLACDSDAPAIEVTQHRFRPVGSNAPELQWTTPACFRYASAGALGEQCVEVTNGTHRFGLGAKACPDWLVGNAGGVGHYLPRYDAALGDRLLGHFAEIPEPEAIALGGDVSLLARTGLMPVAEALRYARAMLHHPSPALQKGATTVLLVLRDAWLSRSELDAKLDVLTRDVLPLARQVGWVERANETNELRELREALLPLAARYEERDTLRMHARELALRWLVRRDSVAADMADAILATAGRFADPPMYERLEAAMLGAKDRGDRNKLIAALAAVRDEKLRARALGLTLDPRLDGRDALSLLSAALNDELNREAAFDFLRAHFDAIAAKLPEDSPGRLTTPLAELCTPAARATFVEFWRDRAPRFLDGAKRYAEALESIDLCIAARAAN